MEKLIKGIVDFREHIRPSYRETFARLALGQSPDTLLICCSDSRVVPNLFASTDPGDVFVLRNVGNLIPPCGENGINVYDKSEAAAVEYAVEQLKVKDIVICGHSECGANIAIMQEGQGLSVNLRDWLRHGESAFYELKSGHSLDKNLKPHNQLSQLNVLQQLHHLRSYPCVRRAIEEGNLRLHGWWFDLAEAEVLTYEPTQRKFTVIDEEEANAILERNLQ